MKERIECPMCGEKALTIDKPIEEMTKEEIGAIQYGTSTDYCSMERG
jgi:hypothetical protein